MSTEHHYHDWADLVADLIHELTEKNGEIEFDNLIVGVPVSSKPDAPQAPWRLHGKVRIRTNPTKSEDAMYDGDGDLVIETHKGTLHVRGERGGFVLRADSMEELSALKGMAHDITPGPRAGITRFLKATHTRLRVVVHGNEIAWLGTGAAPGRLSRWMHLPEIELHAWPLVRALLGVRGSPRTPLP